MKILYQQAVILPLQFHLPVIVIKQHKCLTNLPRSSKTFVSKKIIGKINRKLISDKNGNG